MLPRNMDTDKCAHNHLFLNTQTQKIGISLVAASEENTCDPNGKPSTPTNLTASTLPSPQQG